MLSRCCFHHIVENSILYKKRYTALLHRTNTFSENKIILSVVGGKVDGQNLAGTRSEKPKILSGTRDEKRKNLSGTKLHVGKKVPGSQRVKHGGEPLYFRPVHGEVQRANLSRASAQVWADSPRFTFVPSLFIRKRFIEEYTSYLQKKHLRRINFLSTKRQQRLKT